MAESRCYVCGSPGAPLHDRVQDMLLPGGPTYSFYVCQNPACRHGWLRAASSPEPDAYPADYYTHVPSQPAGFFGRTVARVKRSRLGYALGYVMYLQDQAPGRMLEVGCGSGSRLAELRDRGWEVQGLEPDETAVAVAREHYQVPVVAGMLEKGTFPPGSFDAVVMTHVIEHVADPIPLLGVCRSLLRPGGRVVITCPNLDSYGHAKYGAAWIGLDPPRHEHLFTLDSLVAVTRAAGFSSVRARTSVRGALGNLVGSEQVRAAGHRRGRVVPSLRAKGLALTAVELAHLARNRRAGEEIALAAS